jgi:TPR repeat protein
LSYISWQSEEARSLSPNDRQWITAVMKQDADFARQFASACAQLIDQEQVSASVEALAAEGNGASAWLLAMGDDNFAARQKHLRAAAAAGFPQAQFDLAAAIVGGLEGAAGSGPEAVSGMAMLRQASDQLPRAEAQLALCEYSGCEGAAPDIDSAIMHARDAAKQGSIDALIAMGPHLSASQLDPDELAAWNLVHVALQENGSSGSLDVRWMKNTAAALAATRASANAHLLADQYWQDYGTQMMIALGCAG